MRDRTATFARRIRRDLREGERVRASVAVAVPGTAVRGLAAAARAADGVPALDRERAVAAEGGPRGPHLLLTITSERVLVHRRSLFGRPREIELEAPLDAVEVTVSKPGHAVWLALADGRRVRLETPKAFKFLPEVYARLPEIAADARRDGT